MEGRSGQRLLARVGTETGSERELRPKMQRRSGGDGIEGTTGEGGGGVGSSHRRAWGFADGVGLHFTIALLGVLFQTSNYMNVTN